MRGKVHPIWEPRAGTSPADGRGRQFRPAAGGSTSDPSRADRWRKSVGVETTFLVDLFTYEARRGALQPIVDKAALSRGRSGPEASSNGSATHCSNLSVLSREAFGFWVSPYRRWRRSKPSTSASSACPSRLWPGAAGEHLSMPREQQSSQPSAGRTSSVTRLNWRFWSYPVTLSKIVVAPASTYLCRL